MAPAGPPSFAGERLLQVPLPNYEEARNSLSTQLWLAVVIWWMLVPRLGLRWIARDTTRNNNSNSNNNNHSSSSAYGSLFLLVCIGTVVTMVWLLLVQSPNNALTSRGVFEAPFFSADECQELLKRAQAAAERNCQSAVDNSTTTKPKSKQQEQQQKLLQQEPKGWQKGRHSSYQTVDLNLVTDPFEQDDRKWLADRLNARLAPLLARVHGIPIGSIRANDLFVVRYDAVVSGAANENEGDSSSHFYLAHLDRHTDNGDISFNVLLNQGEFEGGGTRFWKTSSSNRRHRQRRNKLDHGTPTAKEAEDDDSEPFATVQPSQSGTVLFHSATIRHEGLPVTSGTRYILVGFTNVDNVHPTTTTTAQPLVPTNLSWYASWLSLSWLSVRMRTGQRIAEQQHDLRSSDDTATITATTTTSTPTMSLFSRIQAFFYRLAHQSMQTLMDVFCTHHFTQLISNEHARLYFIAMDRQYRNQHHISSKSGDKNKNNNDDQNGNNRASWFAGQHLTLNVKGSIYKEWDWRQQNAHRYKEFTKDKDDQEL